MLPVENQTSIPTMQFWVVVRLNINIWIDSRGLKLMRTARHTCDPAICTASQCQSAVRFNQEWIHARFSLTAVDVILKMHLQHACEITTTRRLKDGRRLRRNKKSLSCNVMVRTCVFLLMSEMTPGQLLAFNVIDRCKKEHFPESSHSVNENSLSLLCPIYIASFL